MQRRSDAAALVPGQHVQLAEELAADRHDAGRQALDLGDVHLDRLAGEALPPLLTDGLVGEGVLLGREDVRERRGAGIALDAEQRLDVLRVAGADQEPAHSACRPALTRNVCPSGWRR